MLNMQINVQYTNKKIGIRFIIEWSVHLRENDRVYKLKYMKIKNAITR